MAVFLFLSVVIPRILRRIGRLLFILLPGTHQRQRDFHDTVAVRALAFDCLPLACLNNELCATVITGYLILHNFTLLRILFVAPARPLT